MLSIPYSVRALGVQTGYPYYADVVITGMKHVLAKCYIITVINASSYPLNSPTFWCPFLLS